MRKLAILLAVLHMVLNPALTYSQEEIISVVPSSGFPGQEIDVMIRGRNTHFRHGISVANFGEGITVTSFNVTNIETGVARIRISPTASISLRTVTVTTGTELAAAEGVFDVLEKGSRVTASMQIMPAQTIYIADFDISDPAKTPVLFNVILNNDNIARTLKLRLTVSGEQFGEIATAGKTISNFQPNAVVQVNNTQFDKYTLSPNGTAFIDKTLKTGILPPDMYVYFLEVFDEQGNKLTEAEGKNLITNTINRPELISPGNSFSLIPEVIPAKFPLFQWFSQQAKSYDLYVYPVFDNQTTPEEASQNRTVFEIKDLTANNFPYPLSAELLQEGKTYAWQIRSHVSGSRGDILLNSEVFWFTVQSSTGPISGGTKITQLQVNQIKISPDDAETGISEKIQFKAIAYDFKGDTVSIKPEWKVVPSDFGTISSDGLFTAGLKPGMVAVIIRYGDQQDYCTVTINWKEEYILKAFGIEGFLQQVFGLPK